MKVMQIIPLDRRSPSRRATGRNENISLACQGLVSAWAVRALLEIQKRERPYVFFLSKTHLGKAKAEILKQKLGCDHFIIHESDGRSGGLLMLWRKDIVIQNQGVSQYFIDVVIRGNEEWRLTGI